MEFAIALVLVVAALFASSAWQQPEPRPVRVRPNPTREELLAGLRRRDG